MSRSTGYGMLCAKRAAELVGLAGGLLMLNVLT
jgi:hypothetical protein